MKKLPLHPRRSAAVAARIPALPAKRLVAAASLLVALAVQAAPPAGSSADGGATAAGNATTSATTPADDAIMKLLGDRGLLKPLGPLGAPVAMVQSLRESVRDTASDLVMTAMNFLGVPYRRGGNTEDSGFDCSGFTRHIFERSIGLVLPRRADEQARTAGLTAIGRQELKPGDLVFFNTMKATFSHVGIYIGDDKFIHAPRAGSAVRIEDMRESYWASRFTGARRADLTAATPAPTVQR